MNVKQVYIWGKNKALFTGISVTADIFIPLYLKQSYIWYPDLTQYPPASGWRPSAEPGVPQ